MAIVNLSTLLGGSIKSIQRGTATVSSSIAATFSFSISPVSSGSKCQIYFPGSILGLNAFGITVSISGSTVTLSQGGAGNNWQLILAGATTGYNATGLVWELTEYN